MIIKEFRVILPMSVDEYKIAQLWSTAEASKNETGGGEGIEVKMNEPFDTKTNTPNPKLLNGDPRFDSGQYTYKIYHLNHKVPSIIRLLAPKGSLELEERAWNSYPYCRTLLQNSNYMKEKFFIKVESMHLGDFGTEENIHGLSNDLLQQREIVFIDIANDQLENASDYKDDQDPRKFRSMATGRGPLNQKQWWKDVQHPVMCAYKLVICEFKWWGLQTKIEKMIHKQERRIFTNFHRMVFCWMDQWYGLSLSDVRLIESQTQQELAKQLRSGEKRGTLSWE